MSSCGIFLPRLGGWCPRSGKRAAQQAAQKKASGKGRQAQQQPRLKLKKQTPQKPAPQQRAAAPKPADVKVQIINENAV